VDRPPSAGAASPQHLVLPDRPYNVVTRQPRHAAGRLSASRLELVLAGIDVVLGRA
jgi:hypothetical protein